MHPEVSSEDSHSEVESVISRYRLTMYEKKALWETNRYIGRVAMRDMSMM